MVKIIGLIMIIGLWACSDNPTPVEEKANVGLLPIDNSKDTLRVASLNLSVGWRAEDLLLKQLNDSQIVYQALVDLYAQYQSSQAEGRMNLVAQKIHELQPDAIALQEAQVMILGDSVEFSFADSILSALQNQGDLYRVVLRQDLNRLDLDVKQNAGRMKLNFWEGNVLLVREGIDVIDTASATYQSRVDFSILGSPAGSTRGWIRATLRTPHQSLWQLWNTHLEVELLATSNTLQGQELNALLWDSWQTLPEGAQIVVGDINAQPSRGGMGALTSAQSGLVDVWSTQNLPAENGYSCCIANYQDSLAGFNRRIDYQLVRNVGQSVRLETWMVGSPLLWASDHALLLGEYVQ